MLIYFIFLQNLLQSINGLSCDQIIKSFEPGSNKRGSFHSPNFPNTYPSDSRCVYKFIGAPNEKVIIKFKYFYIEGLLAKCNKDFLDIYIEMKNADVPLDESSILGRFCGRKLAYVPNTLVSLFNIITLDFYAAKNTQSSYNQDGHMGKLGFNGTYQFTSNAPYAPGIPGSSIARPSQLSHQCHFPIRSTDHNEGFIRSPTFPGIYPGNINCSYQLLGMHNQRIQLIFSILDLNHQTKVCIDDYVLVYDGRDESSPVIGGRFCDRHENLTIVSTGPDLFIRFVTGSSPRRVVNQNDSSTLQRSGFNLFFHFGENYVKLNTRFLRDNHIRGTECDLIIKSTGKSRGQLSSPGKRMPSNKTCTYFLVGIHNRKRMETAVIKFINIDIPASTDNKCSKGSLAIYSVNYTPRKIELYPQPLTLPNKPDHLLCGTNARKFSSIRCDGPLVLLRLNTVGSFRTIGGFQLSYVFQSDYGIKGFMPYDDRCYFVYNLTNSNKTGFTNSPFFGRHYPPNTTCEYNFIIPKNYRIQIYFKSFSLANADTSKAPYHSVQNRSCGGRDRIKVIEYLYNQSPLSRGTQLQELCSSSIPGPIVTQKGSTKLVLLFESVTPKSHEGFKLFYSFNKNHVVTKHKCGKYLQSKTGGGIITSYNYPLNYPSSVYCEWKIKAQKATSRIMIRFQDFVVEEFSQSCANTVLRLYDGKNTRASSELCGTDSSIPEYISSTNEVTLKFITSPRASGQKGFKLIWTEILSKEYTADTCPQFWCDKKKVCINKALECDGISHCGTYLDDKEIQLRVVSDSSDEVKNCPDNSSYSLLHIGLGIIVTMLILILLVVYVLYKEHRKQHIKSISTTQNCNSNPAATTAANNHSMNIPGAGSGGAGSSHPLLLNQSRSANPDVYHNHVDTSKQHLLSNANHIQHPPPDSAPPLTMPMYHQHQHHHHSHHQQVHSTTSSSTQSHNKNSSASLGRPFSSSSKEAPTPLPMVIDYYPKTPSLTSLRRAQSTKQLRTANTTPTTDYSRTMSHCNHHHGHHRHGHHTPHHHHGTSHHNSHHHGHGHHGNHHHGHHHHRHHSHHHSNRSLTKSLSKSHNCGLNNSSNHSNNNNNHDPNFDFNYTPNSTMKRYNRSNCNLNYNSNTNCNNHNFYTIPTNNFNEDEGVWTREKMQKISIV